MRLEHLLLLLSLVACTTSPPVLDQNEEVSRIAFGSCALQWEPQPIWNSVLATDPDLFLFLGDAIYGDWDGENVLEVSEESLRAEWDKLGEQPDFAHFRQRVPILATWDNHDYGKHDGGAEFKLKEESKTLFLDFFGEPQESERRKRPGIHDAKIFGPEGRRVQVILLDTRTFKSPFVKDTRSAEERKALGLVSKYLPNRDPETTILSREQWIWLEEQLSRPADVRLICSSTQVIADQKGMDEWGNFPHERERMFETIAASGACGVLLLSGNVHFGETSAASPQETSMGYPLHDHTSSGLTHIERAYAEVPNPYRCAGPLVEFNFGLVEIDWSTSPSPTIRLGLANRHGEIVHETNLTLDQLKP